MTALVLLAALGAALWWVCASPVRLAAVAVAVLAAYPVPAMVLTVLVAAVLIGLAVVIVYRSLCESGGRLILVMRTVPGGVAA